MTRPKPPNGSSDHELSNIDTKIYNYLIVMISVFFAALVLWLIVFIVGMNVDKNTIGDLGTVGDYFGGLLNPFFAFMAFLLLTHSIRLQLKEMSETRKALQETSAETRRAAEAQLELTDLQRKNLKTQKRIVELQTDNLIFAKKNEDHRRFENTFFNSYNHLTSDFTKMDLRFDFFDDGTAKSLSVNMWIAAFCSKYWNSKPHKMLLSSSDLKRNDFYSGEFAMLHSELNFEFYNFMYSMCDVIFFLLNLIYETDHLSDEERDFYLKVLKAGVGNHHLIWIFLCSFFLREDLAKLLRKSAFFENIRVVGEALKNMKPLTIFYEKETFGKNESWIS